jgi:hypothetical protein
MNDEANVDYASVIAQMTEGHQFLLREFGVKPRIGWHFLLSLTDVQKDGI